MSETEINHFTEEDSRLLAKLKITAEENVFLTELWKKLKTDKQESKSSSKIKLTSFTMTIFALVSMGATIFDKSWAPLANVSAISLIIMNLLFTILIGILFIFAVVTHAATEKKKELKLTLVNRNWIGLLPSRRSPLQVMETILGWLVVIVTIGAGYMITGGLMLVVRIFAWGVLKAVRAPIKRTLNEGTLQMFPPSIRHERVAVG